jgi:hypothetical protein
MDPSPPAYAKCECVHCSGHLEFERGYAGMTIPCPHCGGETVLTLPPPPAPDISIPHISISHDLAATPAPAPAAAPPVPSAVPPVPDHVEEHGANLPHYPAGGGEIHLGDRVRYKDIFAKVVFVSDGHHGKHAPGFSEFEGTDVVIALCDDDGETYRLKEEEPSLRLIHR